VETALMSSLQNFDRAVAAIRWLCDDFELHYALHLVASQILRLKSSVKIHATLVDQCTLALEHPKKDFLLEYK
jgi:hypothetical protein